MASGTPDNNDGTIVLLAPTGGVSYGDLKVIGGILACAMVTLAAAISGTFRFRGKLTAATKVGSQAWTAGDALYWDDTNHRFTKSSTGNSNVVAIAAADAGSGAGVVTGDVILLGVKR